MPLRSLVIAGSAGDIVDEDVAEPFARIVIPEMRALPAAFLEVGPSYRSAKPEGTKRWSEI